ncbi:nucleoside-binding protein [Psychrobacillus sp. OK028]|uniref:BMP family lipoprotein n=1 Tax=Psychrobacillus sp. OK028 TaxID=1884359 RepID=UPI0008927907|nr:BMP family ABC transporter substrate-binding protein [Psychrobacillus sp. OK028]SDN58370.1 nucleoside-binding protein [Psychrobacillus sp. OK028]
MKKSIMFILFISLLIITGCTEKETTTETDHIKVGIMLSDAGLGDQSFSDLGFQGLEKARDELNISFDYREIADTKTYAKGIEELVKTDNDLIIGLGFSIQKDLETIAKKYPKKSFLLVDAQSDLPNVYTVTFKEEEASFLLGAIAGMKTTSNVVGFVGGDDVPLIQKFEKGFAAGVKSENPEATVLSTYAGDFGNDKLGENIAKEMIASKADFIYPAAGFTGVGVINETQRSGIYSFGVDSDQFYLAEKAVVSSMLKQVDVAIFNTIQQLVETGEISEKNQVLGIKENGVSIAPIRVLKLSPAETNRLEKLQEDIAGGSITILK